MMGHQYLHPIHVGPMFQIRLLYRRKREAVALKFLYPNGSLFLTLFVEACHLWLATDKSSF